MTDRPPHPTDRPGAGPDAAPSRPRGWAGLGAGLGARLNALRIRRGAPPRDAVPRMEHFHVTSAEKRRRAEMERSRGRIVIAAGCFAALFAVAIGANCAVL